MNECQVSYPPILFISNGRDRRTLDLEELAGAGDDLLQLLAFVVLTRELLVHGVELKQLLLLVLEHALERVERTDSSVLRAVADVGRAGQELVDGAGRLGRDAEFAQFAFEVAQFALHLVAALDIAHVPALERRELRVEVREGHDAQIAQLLHAVVGRVLVHDERDVLHLLGAKPPHDRFRLGFLWAAAIGECAH